ncbi:SMP-30/gluconolactonase/LRE family protein [Agaribacterium sp. ZY112]|uniref:SMP-30/gluconolactonase/LRE family protein n=1 Tax=Agaribacterium sp. ZY112 TaxID=3233574 RepID=UPI003524CC77
MRRFRSLLICFMASAALTACQTQTQTPTDSTSADSKEMPRISNYQTGRLEIYDDRALNFFEQDQQAHVLAEGFEWTEGPLWVESGQYLLFSDIPRNKIMKYEPESKTLSTYLDNSGWSSSTHLEGYGSNGLLLNQNDELILMQTGQRQVALMQASLEQPKSEFLSLASHYQGKRLNSPNDAVFDNNFNLYFTDPTHGLNDKDKRYSELDFSGVYRINADKELSLVSDELSFPNGIGLSTDEKTLYVAVSDKTHAAWYHFDVKSDGSLGKAKIFYDAKEEVDTSDKEHPGLPDGMSVHSSGAIFATGPHGLWLFAPDGTVLARVFIDSLVSNAELNADESVVYLSADDYLMSFNIKKGAHL